MFSIPLMISEAFSMLVMAAQIAAFRGGAGEVIVGFDHPSYGHMAVMPNAVRRARTHGFLVRMKTRGGRAVINARRAKGRKRLSV